MGVRGLTTFIKRYDKELLHEFSLHSSCLVLDGAAVCSKLYERVNCYIAFGGDYDKFASYVRHFFTNLQKCNVTPLVVFDGSYDYQRLSKVKERLKGKINSITETDLLKQGNLKIVPLLFRDVFKEALTDVNVQFTVCPLEADYDIAALARILKCPVLSNDSDFFVYDVQYIPLDTMEIEPILFDQNNHLYAMKCKVYKAKNLMKKFPGLQKMSLILLTALLGNDNFENNIFKKFLSTLYRNNNKLLIYNLLKWLQNETFESARVKILTGLKENERNKVDTIITANKELYENKYCESLKYFDEDLINNVICMNKSEDYCSYKIDSIAKSPAMSSMPTWVAQKIRNKHITKNYSNLYTHHMYIYSIQVEDFEVSDAFCCTLPIIRYAFDIITDFSLEDCIYITRNKDLDNIESVHIDKRYAITRPLQVSFKDLTNDQLNLYFHHFLRQHMKLLDVATIKMLPSNYHLFMISILWWIKTCEVSSNQVYSLFICLIMLSIIDKKTGNSRYKEDLSEKYEKINKSQGSKQNMESTTDLNIATVSCIDSFRAAQSLITYFEIDERIKSGYKRLDIQMLHSFSQFQCCLLQFNSLNTLCCFPFEKTRYCETFNGTFVYNMATLLEGQKDHLKFFKNLFNYRNSVYHYYKKMCQIYQRCANTMHLTTSECSYEPPNSKIKRTMGQRGQRSLNFNFHTNTTAFNRKRKRGKGRLAGI